MKLFVYGTLRKGGDLNWIVQNLPTKEARVQGSVYYNNRLPYLTLSMTKKDVIVGELIDVPPALWIRLAHMEMDAGYVVSKVRCQTTDGEVDALAFTKELESASIDVIWITDYIKDVVRAND